jgi:flagellar biosynthesis component FlhA
MNKIGLRNAIWRSRAVAIIGFLVMLLAIFPGLPSTLKNTLFVVFGLLTLSFGFAGSRHKSYSDPEIIKAKEVEEVMKTEQIYPTVERAELELQVPIKNEEN